MGKPVVREPSAEPVKDTDMSEPLPEFETRIKEREFVDISV